MKLPLINLIKIISNRNKINLLNSILTKRNLSTKTIIKKTTTTNNNNLNLKETILNLNELINKYKINIKLNKRLELLLLNLNLNSIDEKRKSKIVGM